MQRMDSFDASKGKTFFKKRAHRPWNAALLENTLESASSPLECDSLATIIETEGTEIKLQRALEEKTKERNEIHEQLNTEEENRLLIGGFLHPQNIFSQNGVKKSNNTNYLINELKNKEQEILSLASDLKISKALEQAEKLEISIKKEEEARKSAENKALFAIQEAKIAAEQTYKIEQQLHAERQSRIKEEKARKALEENNYLILQEIAQKEELLLRAEKARELAEEKIKQTLEEAKALEQRIKLESEYKIKKIADEMSEQIEKYKTISEETAKKTSEEIASIQTESQEKIKLFQKQMDEKIKRIEFEADRKINEAQKQRQIHEKAKISIKIWAQKSIDAAQKIEAAKKEIENKY